jgi:hypothetical protein
MKSHPQFGIFCGSFRDALFGIRQQQIVEIKDKLKKGGMTDLEIERVYKYNYSYFVKNSMRCIPEPDHLV